MRTQRTMAVLAATGAFLMAAASVLLAPGAASAAPRQNEHYPAPPSTISISSGTVRAGNSVGVSGVGFGEHEPVVVQTRFRPRSVWFPRHGIVTHQQTVWTNRDGEFRTRVPTFLPGSIIITARGLRSGERGSATVRVLPRHMGSGGYGGWYYHGVPGMQAVDNTVGRWMGMNYGPARVGWRAW